MLIKVQGGIVQGSYYTRKENFSFSDAQEHDKSVIKISRQAKGWVNRIESVASGEMVVDLVRAGSTRHDQLSYSTRENYLDLMVNR